MQLKEKQIKIIAVELILGKKNQNPIAFYKAILTLKNKKMAYTACYTCFDGDTDMHYYNLMKAWHKNGKFNFMFDNVHDLEQVCDSSTEETIKRSLRR